MSNENKKFFRLLTEFNQELIAKNDSQVKTFLKQAGDARIKIVKKDML